MRDFTKGKTGAKNLCVRVRHRADERAVLCCDMLQCGVIAEGLAVCP